MAFTLSPSLLLRNHDPIHGLLSHLSYITYLLQCSIDSAVLVQYSRVEESLFIATSSTLDRAGGRLQFETKTKESTPMVAICMISVIDRTDFAHKLKTEPHSVCLFRQLAIGEWDCRLCTLVRSAVGLVGVYKVNSKPLVKLLTKSSLLIALA